VLLIESHSLIVTSRTGYITALALEDGQARWVRTGQPDSPATEIGGGGGYIALPYLSGMLRVWEARQGTDLWQLRPGSGASWPLAIANGVLFASTQTGLLALPIRPE
jgi:outer membrane protein assembly factor BamB